jgi:23S rRNA pseudouridine1911/1915/1917 synthase
MSALHRLRIPRSLNGARLDEALSKLLEGPSRSLLQKWVRKGQLKLDGRVVHRSNERVRTGQEYVLRVPTESGGTQSTPPVADPTWKLIHEDEDLLVVDKPAGMLTHAAPRSKDVSLCELVGRTHGPLPTSFGPERPGVVHRLDRWTSGLLVLAKTEDAMHGMKAAFAARRVAKRYLALVYGREVPAAFDCDAPLTSGRGGSDRQWVGPGPNAKPAQTRFEPLEQLGAFTLLRCEPRTGRRHQIRAHLWSAELALIGEEIYRLPTKPGWPAGVPRTKRQTLHAAGLEFTHPRTGQALSFESPWPADLQPLLDGLRRAAR